MNRYAGVIPVVILLLTPFLLFGCSARQAHLLESSLPDKGNKTSSVSFPPSSIAPIATFKKDGPVYSIAWSPTGRFLAIGGRGDVLIWDANRRERFQTLSGLRGDVVSLVFSPDGETLAAGSYRAIDLWHVRTGRRLGTLTGQAGYVTALAFSPDGQHLASGSGGDQGSIYLWNVMGKRVDKRLSYATKYAETIRRLTFSSNGDRLAAVGLDRRIRIWQIEKDHFAQVPDQVLFDPEITPRSLVFSPGKNVLAVGTLEGQTILYELPEGEILGRFQLHQGEVSALAFSGDGARLVSSGKDRRLQQWNIHTGEIVKTKRVDEMSDMVAISQDGRFFAAYGRSGTAVFSMTAKKGIPPVIAILTPSADATVDQSAVMLTGKIVDDRGVTEVVIRVNDVVRPRKNRVGTRDLMVREKHIRKEIILNEALPLRTGKNVITVTAFDLEGLVSSETLRVSYLPEKGAIWAAVIGISQYQHVKGLRYADADAKSFYDYLIHDNEIPEDHVTLLLNEEATLQRMRDLLGVELKEKARKQDTVIIYYAGHGAPEPDRSSLDGDGLEKYLLPYDADPKRLFSTALPMAEVSKIFSRISAQRVVMLQDTCFSGSSGESGIGGRTIRTALIRAPISMTFLDRMTRGKGRVIITASEANEVSLERDDMRHGVFTYYLLEALQKGDIDKDGLITTSEVFRYVSEKVPPATGQNQHPVKKGIESSEIVLGRVRRD